MPHAQHQPVRTTKHCNNIVELWINNARAGPSADAIMHVSMYKVLAYLSIYITVYYCNFQDLHGLSSELIKLDQNLPFPEFTAYFTKETACSSSGV